MTEKEAIEIVEKYNKWRRGQLDDLHEIPKNIGIAIDILIQIAKDKNNIKDENIKPMKIPKRKIKRK